MSRFATQFRETVLVFIALGGLALGGVLVWLGRSDIAVFAWGGAAVPVLGALFVEIVQALRRGDIGLDLVAALSMSAALAFGEPLAANVVALMYAGGQLLESYAEGRARREMTALLGRVARTAMVERAGVLSETPIEAIIPGDTVLIRRGDVLPVDGRVAQGETALLDPAAITGESLPRRASGGEEVPSGATSAGEAFRLVAIRPAAKSTYAGIVRLVEAAQEAKAPMTRLADRYALGFLALTLAIAGAAWALSGEASRALAVLVCATPCPLILAVPVALISGISRAAKAGVLVKDGGVFEALARVKVAILDKTGTLTHGNAVVSDVRVVAGREADEVLRLAAGLDQASGHPMAATLIAAAHERKLTLEAPTGVSEVPGAGIAGIVAGQAVAVGGDGYVRELTGDDPFSLHPPGPASATIAVAIDRKLAGIIVIEDRLRPDARGVVGLLKAGGIERTLLASGDRAEIVDAIGPLSGADAWFANMSAGDKVDLVKRERALGPVMMVGDGINDAPALAAADVGVAMGAQGATVSSETAGVVVLVDALTPLVTAMNAARRSLKIALQSVGVGLGLSIAAMVVAAFGYLPPVQGALVQEAIDVAVILNALRALR